MSSLRITGGTLRGRRIPVPSGEVRPTSERARQAVFNIVGERLVGARFLDLFAGSGIFSFEALSRGSREAVAMDAVRTNTAAIDKAARELHLPLRTLTAEVLGGIKRLKGEVFDLVYADPPYAYERHEDLLMAIDREIDLAPGAVVAIEHRRRTDPFRANPTGSTATLTRLKASRRAEYGEVWITFFTA